MFKIHTGVVPEYLREIVQNKRGNISKYNARNKRQYDIPIDVIKTGSIQQVICTRCCPKKGTCYMQKNTSSISIFRQTLFTKFLKSASYFSMGKRNINIIHTKLRHVCSYLIMIYSDENSLIVIFALMDGCLFSFVFRKYSNARNTLPFQT